MQILKIGQRNKILRHRKGERNMKPLSNGHPRLALCKCTEAFTLSRYHFIFQLCYHVHYNLISDTNHLIFL